MWKYFKSIACLRNFYRQGTWASIHILAQLPGRLGCQKSTISPWESHTHTQPGRSHSSRNSGEREWSKGLWNQAKHLLQTKLHLSYSDPVSEETLSSLHHTIIFMFLCGSHHGKLSREFAREDMEVTTENWWPDVFIQVVTWKKRWGHGV